MGTKFTDGAGSGFTIFPSAVWGDSDYTGGVAGTTASGRFGVFGRCDAPSGTGVFGYFHGQSGSGVYGTVIGPNYSQSPPVTGVSGVGYGPYAYGISGTGGNIGVFAQNTTAPGNVAYLGTQGLAADFYGDVWMHNNVFKPGGGFRIDDPRKPAERYLQHSFVESSDMKNLYDGVATLDARGKATVHLPPWFETLNNNFRYQLTCIGAYAPIYIAQEIKNGSFKIAGGSSGAKVSWLVTGIRKDPWAEKNRLKVELDKPKTERGLYIHPELYGKPASKGVRTRYGKSPAVKTLSKTELHKQALLAKTIGSSSRKPRKTKKSNR